MKEFTTCMCVPGCIDLYAAASQTCLSKPTEDKEMKHCTAWLPGIFHASVAVETQHQLSLEGDNKPYVDGESSFVPWQWSR